METWLYILVRQENPGLQQVLDIARNQFASRYPANTLSVTFNVAGDRAIVKTDGDDSPFNGRAVVLDQWRSADHQNKLAEIGFYTPAWQPEENL